MFWFHRRNVPTRMDTLCISSMIIMSILICACAVVLCLTALHVPVLREVLSKVVPRRTCWKESSRLRPLQNHHEYGVAINIARFLNLMIALLNVVLVDAESPPRALGIPPVQHRITNSSSRVSLITARCCAVCVAIPCTMAFPHTIVVGIILDALTNLH